MEVYKFCQSCCMPLDDKDVLGTEKNGSKSMEYCKYCYQGGEFTSPGMTLEEMKVFDRDLMHKMNMSEETIAKTLAALPGLNRWTGKTKNY